MNEGKSPGEGVGVGALAGCSPSLSRAPPPHRAGLLLVSGTEINKLYSGPKLPAWLLVNSVSGPDQVEVGGAGGGSTIVTVAVWLPSIKQLPFPLCSALRDSTLDSPAGWLTSTGLKPQGRKAEGWLCLQPLRARDSWGFYSTRRPGGWTGMQTGQLATCDLPTWQRLGACTRFPQGCCKEDRILPSPPGDILPKS